MGSVGSQRLMDWSYAGYMAGEAEIPLLPKVASVKVRMGHVHASCAEAILGNPV